MTRVAVIGGGIIGLATARELALRGAHVTVLEQGMLASGTSSRGEGNMLVSDKLIPAEARLALRSLHLWRRFAEESSQSFEYEPKGGIITAGNGRQLDLLTAQAGRQQQLGIRSEVVSAARLRELEPQVNPGLIGGVLYPQDAQVMPIQAVLALGHAARVLGVELRTDARVVGLGDKGSGLSVALADGHTVQADAVVQAVGPWAGELSRRLGGHAAVFPRRGLLLVTEPMPPDTVCHKVYDGRYVEAVGSDDATAQVAPVVESTRAGTILIGSTREAVGWDAEIRWDLAGQLARDAINLFPRLATAQVMRTYQGFRPATPDHLPLIGPDAQISGLFHHTGHEGAGIGLALASAEVLAAAMLDGVVDPDFDPRRFTPDLVVPADQTRRARPLALQSAVSPAVQPHRAAELGARHGEVFCGIGHCHACVVSDAEGRTVRACLTRDADATSPAPDQDVTAVDVLIVGAGPGGLAAAARLRSADLRVGLVDRYRWAGGQIGRQPDTPAAPVGPYGGLIASGLAGQNVCHLAAATVLMVRRMIRGSQRFEALVQQAGHLRIVRADTVILASGAREVVVPFPGWTLPGVVTAGAVQAIVKRQGRLPWQRVGLAGSGPLLLAVAQVMDQSGQPPLFTLEAQSLRRLAVGGVTTGARFPRKAALFGRLTASQRPRFGWQVVEALGSDCLQAVVIGQVGPDGRTRRARTVALDALGISSALVPDVTLARQLGCATSDSGDGVASHVTVDGSQQTTIPGVYAVGETTGVGGADKAIAEGRLAGAVAGGAVVGGAVVGGAVRTGSVRTGSVRTRSEPDTMAALQQEVVRWRRFAADLQRLYPFDHSWAGRVSDQEVVCRCEQVSAGQMRRAIDDGAHTARAIKGLTRCGMGRCQAAVCSPLVRSLLHTAGHDGVGDLESRPLAGPVAMDQLSRLAGADE